MLADIARDPRPLSMFITNGYCPRLRPRREARQGQVLRPFKMLEFTYCPRRRRYSGGLRLALNKRRRGPFLVLKFAPGNWIELLVGWQHGRR